MRGFLDVALHLLFSKNCAPLSHLVPLSTLTYIFSCACICTGLSYTSFNLTWADTPPAPRLVVSSTTNATLSISVANAGAVVGAEVVMLFYTFTGSATLAADQAGAPPLQPLQQLLDYQRVEPLQPGQMARLSFVLRKADFVRYNANGDATSIGLYTVRVSRGHGDVLTVPVLVE